MKNFWILIITATLLSLPYRSSSSTERFRLLDTGNGLFNNQVRFLTQMEDGKILVCTEGMFNVYNGNSFEPLACDLTYTVPWVCTIYAQAMTAATGCCGPRTFTVSISSIPVPDVSVTISKNALRLPV